MNKRGSDGQDFLAGNLIYIILWVVIFAMLVAFIRGYTHGEALWESLYAQQIAQIINVAEPGTNVTLDISPLVELAHKHAKSNEQILMVDNVANKITISTRQDGSTSFYYFNDVDVTDADVQELTSTSGQSVLSFYVRESAK